jgi:lysophospholipase L1-like esterase
MVGDEWEFPAVGSYEERLAITLRFNASLAAAAAEAGHGWLSVFDSLTDGQGRPRPDFFLDGIHLSQQAMPATREAAKRAFPHLDFNHA